MKNIFKTLFLFTLALLFSSCNEDNEVANIDPNYVDKTIATIDLQFDESTSLEEGNQEFYYTVTLSKPVDNNVTINVVKAGGDATNHEDYDAPSVIIPAHSTSATGSIVIYEDEVPEDTETLRLRIGNDLTYFAEIKEDKYVNFTIGNKETNDMFFSMSWDGEYTGTITGSDEVTIDFCAMDFDLILYDGSFGYIGYVLGTGSCPEPEEVVSGLADGTYYLVSDLWDNPNSIFGFAESVPLTLHYRQGGIENSGTLTSTNYTTADTSGMYILAVVTVNGLDVSVEPY